jgi:hypothetical protein
MAVPLLVESMLTNAHRCCVRTRKEAALKAEDLVGTWRLRSWKNVAGDGSAVDPLGEHPLGYIFYNHDGYMSVEIMAELVWQRVGHD